MPTFSFPNLRGRIVALDTESTGLNWYKGDTLFGVGIAYRDESNILQTHYFDIRYPEVNNWMRTALSDVKLWVNHYIKHDAHFMREEGYFYPKGRINCTMIREALIDENKYEYGLDVLSWKYLDRGKANIWPEMAELFGGEPTLKAQILNLPNAPETMVAKYATDDAALALRVWEAQEEIIRKESLERVHNMEMRLLSVIIALEQTGVRVDLDLALKNHKGMHQLIIGLQKQLNQIAGRRDFNANSSDQVKALLGVHLREDNNWYTADDLKLEKNPPNKKNLIGTAKLDSVKLQECKLPAAQKIVDIRGLMKARDTFLGTYILGMSHEEYIHASFNQTRTEDGNGIYTGRISISEPALQQIHKRNKAMAALVRACFIPDPETIWWCFDWSQMDFRMFAHFLNDPRINDVYSNNPDADFHQMAADLTGLPRNRDQRTGGANAKQINLACVFGMGAGKLARECGLPYSINKKGYFEAGPEAKSMFSKYHRAIPGVRKLQDNVQSVANSRGYITTQMGRRIRFPDGKGAHKAAGLLYQSTAADAMKVKMLEVVECLESYNDYVGRLVMTVHDEFDLNMDPRAEAYGVREDLTHILQRFDGEVTPMKFRVPVRADFGQGDDWWSASK